MVTNTNCFKTSSKSNSLSTGHLWFHSAYLPGCPSPTDSDVNMKAPSALRELSHKPSTGPFIFSQFSTQLLQGNSFKAVTLPQFFFLKLNRLVSGRTTENTSA